MTFRSSMIEPGQPCVMSSGMASSCGERMCANWMSSPSVDFDDELGQLVERRLDLAPVVVGAPVLDERPELRQLDTLRPVADGLPIGPPCRRDAPAEVDEILFRTIDAEGSDRDPFPNW